jgi:receptor protein-tyrosine kinase
MLPSEESYPATGTAHDNLSVLPAGTRVGASLSEFVTTHLNAFVEDMRLKADVVVLDLPPCTEYADAARVASYMDETCLVVSAKYTSFRTIPVAQEILAKAGAKDVSIVLTHASPTEEPFSPKTRDLAVRA